MGYGGCGGWGGYCGGPTMTTSTTYATTYTEDPLILDAYDPDSKTLIWRGIGSVTVKDSPEKQTQQVEQILAKIGARWDKILEGKGKLK